jgi:antitoxin (DNA-binding transcriptional repressor) of toxin-antitoxin stability system
MRSVGLKVLKNKLAEYVRLAATGETILVTDRDRVVAEPVAPSASRSELLADAMLADAMREGWLRAPLLSSGPPPPSLPVAPLGEILNELRQDRDGR